MRRHRITFTLGTAAGGLLAAAFLPMAVALADNIGFAPAEPIIPTGVTGSPPDGIETITGQETWVPWDFTTGTFLVCDGPCESFTGVGTETIMGSMTNNLFVDPGDVTVDLANFGNGWGLEWVDVIGTILPDDNSNMGEMLITPMGDFVVSGTFFS